MGRVIATGPQPDVQKCPVGSCNGTLASVPSRHRPAGESHLYKCSHCGREFEINEVV